MARDDRAVDVNGHRIRVSNLDKVLYPSTGTTKGEVLAYYSAIAETMLPHCMNRPATRKRWPDGVGPTGEGNSFFQKDIGDAAPEWVHTGRIQHKDHVNSYPLVNDEATLVWLAQLASLEIHVPQWRFNARGNPMNPDRMVFDLDPGEGVLLRDVAKIAFLVRDILHDMGLQSVPVTSGSSGIHLYAALDGAQTADEVARVAHELARALEADYPDEVTSSMKRSLRPGKVFLDWSQNNGAKTTVAPYSLRGRIAPTVAVPRTWRELASPHLRQLHFDEVLKRVKKRGDPLAALVSEPALERLSEYRSKRDAVRTPEPMPSLHAKDAGGSNSDAEDDSAGEQAGQHRFVIQRHEARRLHHDFRLEHDGVLVSWALPKGPPTDPAVNHLAVPTEDHPMAYRHFEGVIPQGEYGAGTVEIWDAGHYDLEKWRDDEVIATLHGREGGGLGGSKRFALFRAGGSSAKPRWMIHLMEPRSVTDDVSSSSVAPSRTKVSRVKVPRQNAMEEYTPMLAESGSIAELARFDEDEWAFEMKWDGIRALAFVGESSGDGNEIDENSQYVLRSRSGAQINQAYPELSALSAALNAEAVVLDGEIVTLGSDGAPDFSRLQQRFGLQAAREVARAQAAAPVSFFIFDVLSVNGQDCRSLTYRKRRELLMSVIEPLPGIPVVVPDLFAGTADAAREASRELKLEGVVAKRWTSSYSSGVRSADWVKFPFIHTEEVSIIGWRESESEPLGFASLLLASSDADGELVYAGRVGTGFTSIERRRIRKRLESLQIPLPATSVPSDVRADAHWVRPTLVGEVTSKGRTRAGILRQPVWRGLRPDKS